MTRLIECARCDGCGWYEGGVQIATTCEECLGSGVKYEWPDGQIRAEEPYRCGAFLSPTCEQCTKLSDHHGEHDFGAAPPSETPHDLHP